MLNFMFIMKKHHQNAEEFLKDFFSLPKLKKNITLKDLKRIEEESYRDSNFDRHLKKSKRLYSLDTFSDRV